MKLMEWQMSGGDASEAPKQTKTATEAEEAMARLEADAKEGAEAESVTGDNAEAVSSRVAGQSN